MLTKGFDIEQVNKVVVATVHDRELSSASAAELVEQLTSRMRFDNAVYFVLDLKQVEFVSSSCIGTLVAFLQDLEHVRGRIALCHCAPNVQFLFKVTKLDTIFTIYEDRDEAMREIVHG